MGLLKKRELGFFYQDQMWDFVTQIKVQDWKLEGSSMVIKYCVEVS